MPTLSFIILTAGHRPLTLNQMCRVLLGSFGWDIEVLVVGRNNPKFLPGVRYVGGDHYAADGKICHMRNLGGQNAAGDIHIFLDDDLEIPANWLDAVSPLLNKILRRELDIGTCSIVGPNGRRWYDWCFASRTDDQSPPMLLPYNRYDPDLYISGCCMIMHRKVWRRVGFNERLGYYQHDDVDFCHRASDMGFRFGCAPYASLKHLLLPQGRTKKGSPRAERMLAQSIYYFRQGCIHKAQNVLSKRLLKDTPHWYYYYQGLYAFFFCMTATAR